MPPGITAHFIHSAAMNVALDAQVSIENICKATFISHYKMNPLASAEAAFGMWVIE